MSRFLVLFLSLFLSSCTFLYVIDPLDPSKEVEYVYNLHSSLPSDYVTDFHGIMTNLRTLIPVYQKNTKRISIYSWNDSVDKPFSDVNGGAYVSNGHTTTMVLEIPNNEFIYDHNHRFSVIAHEYFHCYQDSISSTFFNQSFRILWLSEGTAASFEGLYIQQYKNYNYLLNDHGPVNSSYISNPSVLESYDTEDSNYTSSTYLVLVLAKELIKQGHSEPEAFRLIYLTYLSSNPTNSDWKETFLDIFGFSVDDFYSQVANYGSDMSQVLPSSTLTLESIFSLP